MDWNGRLTGPVSVASFYVFSVLCMFVFSAFPRYLIMLVSEQARVAIDVCTPASLTSCLFISNLGDRAKRLFFGKGVPLCLSITVVG